MEYITSESVLLHIPKGVLKMVFFKHFKTGSAMQGAQEENIMGWVRHIKLRLYTYLLVLNT